jgi:hypothetical protein
MRCEIRFTSQELITRTKKQKQKNLSNPGGEGVVGTILTNSSIIYINLIPPSYLTRVKVILQLRRSSRENYNPPRGIGIISPLHN